MFSDAALAASNIAYPACIQLLLESIITILALGYFSKIISLTKLEVENVPLISEDKKIPTISCPFFTWVSITL